MDLVQAQALWVASGSAHTVPLRMNMAGRTVRFAGYLCNRQEGYFWFGASYFCTTLTTPCIPLKKQIHTMETVVYNS